MHQPIIPWIGGKRRLSKHILPLIPEHTCYVEPFAGAAAIFFLKQPSKVEVINDINSDLITLYRVVQHHLEEFIRQYKWSLSSREQYEMFLQTPREILTDIQRAVRFFYLQKLSFGGRVSGQTFGTATTSPPRLNFLRLEEELSQAHFRLSRVTIEHLSWHKCVAKYDRPHTFFFADPPYWQTEGYGVDFGMEQYQNLAEVMKASQARFLVTVNDHPDMKKVFKGFHHKTVDIDYTVGGGGKGKGRRELIIQSW
jgi:DNA adenine methylase